MCADRQAWAEPFGLGGGVGRAERLDPVVYNDAGGHAPFAHKDIGVRQRLAVVHGPAGHAEHYHVAVLLEIRV